MPGRGGAIAVGDGAEVMGRRGAKAEDLGKSGTLFLSLLPLFIIFRPFWTQELRRTGLSSWDDEAIILDVSPVWFVPSPDPPSVQALVRRLSAHDPLLFFFFFYRLTVFWCEGASDHRIGSVGKGGQLVRGTFFQHPRDASLLRLFPCLQRGRLPLRRRSIIVGDLVEQTRKSYAFQGLGELTWFQKHS
jgi:hypothetical protein